MLVCWRVHFNIWVTRKWKDKPLNKLIFDDVLGNFSFSILHFQHGFFHISTIFLHTYVSLRFCSTSVSNSCPTQFMEFPEKIVACFHGICWFQATFPLIYRIQRLCLRGFWLPRARRWSRGEVFRRFFVSQISRRVKVAYIFSFTNQSSLRLSVYVYMYIYLHYIYITKYDMCLVWGNSHPKAPFYQA